MSETHRRNDGLLSISQKPLRWTSVDKFWKINSKSIECERKSRSEQMRQKGKINQNKSHLSLLRSFVIALRRFHERYFNISTVNVLSSSYWKLKRNHAQGCVVGLKWTRGTWRMKRLFRCANYLAFTSSRRHLVQWSRAVRKVSKSFWFLSIPQSKELCFRTLSVHKRCSQRYQILIYYRSVILFRSFQ